MAQLPLKHLKIAVATVLIATVAIGGWRIAQNRLGSLHQFDSIALNISQPDVVIRSEQLNQVPQNLLQIPVIKDILTEDVVFYYQEAPTKLSLQGSLQRLAFEHNLTLEDQLIQKLLNRPGEIYAWQGKTNKPDYWMFVGQSDTVSRLAELLAKISKDDSQLIQVDTLKVDGNNIPLFAIYYQNKIGLFASTSERLVFLSDAGMLMQLPHKPKPELQLEAKATSNEDGTDKVTPLSMPKAAPIEGKLISERVDIIEKLLSKRPENQQVITQNLGLQPDKQKHTLYISNAMTSLSYQHLMPALVGNRFDFDGSTWHQSLAVNTSKLPSQGWQAQELFQKMPHNAAFCANVPLDWQLLSEQAKKLPTSTEALNLNQFSQPLVACWYADSPAAAPLLLTKLPQSEQRPALLAALQQVFTDSIGAKEYTHKKRFELSNQSQSDTVMQERIVSARYGSHDMDQLPEASAKELSADHYFPVRYAVQGDYVWFSPNGDLVNQAVSVNQQKTPALNEQMNPHKEPLLWINGPEFATWLQQQTDEVIASDSDMRFVLQERFTPKLQLIRDSGLWQVTTDQPITASKTDKITWYPVSWLHP